MRAFGRLCGGQDANEKSLQRGGPPQRIEFFVGRGRRRPARALAFPLEVFLKGLVKNDRLIEWQTSLSGSLRDLPHLLVITAELEIPLRDFRPDRDDHLALVVFQWLVDR